MTSFNATREIWAEHDDTRLAKRLTRVSAGRLSTDEVNRLTAGELELIWRLPLTAQQSVLALMRPNFDLLAKYESVQGNTVDFVPVAYLERAREAARSVGRILFEGQAEGTGVLVSPHLLLTNNHVLSSPDDARSQTVQFNYEQDIHGQPIPISEFALDPDRFFFTSPKEEHDFTLVAVGARISGNDELATFGFRPLSQRIDKHAEGDFVSIIQHPSGSYKQIVLRENRVLGRGKSGTTLFYGTDTLPGSSGSPVFNDHYDLVALHHAGEPVIDNTTDADQPAPTLANEGIRISAVVKAIVDRRAELAAADQQGLLDEALAPQSNEANEPQAPVTPVVPMPATPVVADGVTRVVIPIEVTFRVQPATSGPPMSAPAGVALERNHKPEADYKNRAGYDADFLPTSLPLPILSAELTAAAALRTDNGKPTLDYHHFSLVVHRDRRMPIYTAVNIDGPTWKAINRTTRQVTDPFESSETWYQDPRLDPKQQLAQADYDALSGFDRGHMVRREDAQWGVAESALAAMDDTFHFTNSCPQTQTFNRLNTFWQGIENYALNGMRRAPERISVFTGPIFDDNVVQRGELTLPTSFWKIVARVAADGRLRATGFIAAEAGDAAPHESLTSRDWPILPGEPVAHFQAQVAEIERRSGLQLPDELHAADTFGNHFEGIDADPIRRIGHPEDASWG